jgi:transcriptional regulator with XRE-family HTH domain
LSKNDLYTRYGALLRQEREIRQLDLEELSEQLKINLEHLEAIEAGDIASLPSELYFALFAKSYSEALGLDYTRTTEAMKAEIEEATRREDRKAGKGAVSKGRAEHDEQDGLRDVPKEKRFTGRLLIVFALLVLAFVVFVYVAERMFGDGPPPEGTHGGAADQAGEGIKETFKDRESDKYGDFDWSVVQPYRQPEKLQLELSAERDSWVTVVADGDTVIFRQIDAGRSVSVMAAYRFRISISVPSAVTTRLNGKDVDLRDPSTRRVSRVEINQANADRYLNPEKYLSQSIPPEPDGSGGDAVTDESIGSQ